MDTQALKDHSIELIHSWEAVLESKGVPYTLPPDLTTLNLFELRLILKEMRDLGRTPT